MTKEEALKFINESEFNNFTINCSTSKPRNTKCDLCGNEGREFRIESKHITSYWAQKYTINDNFTSRIKKEICIECFRKMFPNVMEKRILK